MQLADGTAIAIGTVIFSVGGAWCMVKTMAKRIEQSVTRCEFEELKTNLLDEIRSLRRLLFDQEGQSVYQPRKMCDIQKVTLSRSIDGLAEKLDVMDRKRDVARDQDMRSMAAIKTSIALIEQRVGMGRDDTGGRK